jgi:hypothetical protein
MDTNATLPSVGQTWLADPGPDTPLGHFTGGTIKGNTEKMNYTTAKLRDGLIPAAEIMEVLPAAVRIREATRVLGLAKIREREAQVLVWSAYLAWPGPNQFGSAAHCRCAVPAARSPVSLRALPMIRTLSHSDGRCSSRAATRYPAFSATSDRPSTAHRPITSDPR